MTTKELLLQEIESLPPELLTQTLDFVRFIKSSHVQKQSNIETNVSENIIRGSRAKDLLQFAGTWEGDDIRECLQSVHDNRMPLQE
jgi:hypothetical protein